MIQKKKKNILIFLKKKIYIKKQQKKIIILKSIIQNNQNTNLLKFYIKLFLNKYNYKHLKKKCLFSISNKAINKKSKLSRFAINKINSLNLIQNYKTNG